MNSNRAAHPTSGPEPLGEFPADRSPSSARARDRPQLATLRAAAARADALGAQFGRTQPQMQEAEALFGIRDAPWQLASIEKLASHELPDPAFRLLYPVDCGLLMFANSGA